MRLTKHIITICFLTLLACTSFSQSSHNNNPNLKKGTIARNQIIDLHDNSVLLVRLQSREKSIQAYRDAGKIDCANKKEKEQRENNKNIVNAFEQNFDFCEVYFFYADQSIFVKNDQIDLIVFLDKNLLKDFEIKPDYNNKNIYTFELGTVSDIGLLGGYIMDNEFTKLEKPFPYYAKSPFFATHKKTPFITVKRFNRKLHRYYKRVK